MTDENEKIEIRKSTLTMLNNTIHDHIVVMQAACIEWANGKGAEAAMRWIANTLSGPGLIPSNDEPYADNAQLYFNANRSEPFPVCFCGNPSHIAWMGQGFCCDEHYNEAKAKQVEESNV